MVQFSVLGSPVAQPRQRHKVVQMGGHAVATNYTPAKDPVQQWKSDVKAAAERAGLPEAPWAGPVGVQCTFYLPRPQKFMRRKDPDGAIPCYTGRNDVDNLLKACWDALTGLLWLDDRQICVVYAEKMFHEKTGRPRLEFTARPVAERALAQRVEVEREEADG